MGIQLVVGGGHLDHLVANADSKLLAFRHDVGIHYYEYEPRTSPNELLVEDLGVTLLLNLRVDWRPAKTLACSMMTFDLRRLPDKPLEATTDDERGHLAQLIGQLANSPGFGASVATKLLHKAPNADPRAGQPGYLWGLHECGLACSKGLQRDRQEHREDPRSSRMDSLRPHPSGEPHGLVETGNPGTGEDGHRDLRYDLVDALQGDSARKSGDTILFLS